MFLSEGTLQSNLHVRDRTRQKKGNKNFAKGSSTGEPSSLSFSEPEALSMCASLPNSLSALRLWGEDGEVLPWRNGATNNGETSCDSNSWFDQIKPSQCSHELLGTRILKDWAAAGKSFSAFSSQTRVEVCEL